MRNSIASLAKTERMRMKGKRDPEELEELLERGRAARRQMQEIIDRVEARMQERQARNERSLLRRLFAR
jgi:hypothetical protein